MFSSSLILLPQPRIILMLSPNAAERLQIAPPHTTSHHCHGQGYWNTAGYTTTTTIQTSPVNRLRTLTLIYRLQKGRKKGKVGIDDYDSCFQIMEIGKQSLHKLKLIVCSNVKCWCSCVQHWQNLFHVSLQIGWNYSKLNISGKSCKLTSSLAFHKK